MPGDRMDFGGRAPRPLRIMSQRSELTLARTAGIGEGWNMPVASWSSPGGWGEEFFAAQSGAHTFTVATAPALVTSVLSGHECTSRGEADHFSMFQEGEPIRCIGHKGVRFAEFYIEPRFLGVLADEVGNPIGRSGPLQHFLLHRRDAELRLEFNAYARRTFDDDDPANSLEMNARATVIGLHLLRKFSDHDLKITQINRGGLAPGHLRRVCEYIDAHLGEQVDLRTLAGQCGLSTPHFCTSFARSTGLPPHRWLTWRRIERSKLLMRSPSLGLTEIAQTVGFSGQGSFGAAFRRLTGVSPGAWRRDAMGGRFSKACDQKLSERQ